MLEIAVNWRCHQSGMMGAIAAILMTFTMHCSDAIQR